MTARATLRTSQGSYGLPWLTAFLVLLSLAATWLTAVLPVSLLFDRGSGGAENWIGLLTTHFVHVDQAHLTWNLLPLCLFGGCAEACRLPDHRRLAAGLALAIAFIDAWLVLFPDAPVKYCGLSGPLNAVFVLALLALHRELDSPLPLLVLAAGAVKIAIEWQGGEGIVPALQTPGWHSAPAAHAIGFAAGLLAHFAVPADGRVPGREFR